MNTILDQSKFVPRPPPPLPLIEKLQLLHDLPLLVPVHLTDNSSTSLQQTRSLQHVQTSPSDKLSDHYAVGLLHYDTVTATLQFTLTYQEHTFFHHFHADNTYRGHTLDSVVDILLSALCIVSRNLRSHIADHLSNITTHHNSSSRSAPSNKRVKQDPNPSNPHSPRILTAHTPMTMLYTSNEQYTARYDKFISRETVRGLFHDTMSENGFYLICPQNAFNVDGNNHIRRDIIDSDDLDDDEFLATIKTSKSAKKKTKNDTKLNNFSLCLTKYAPGDSFTELLDIPLTDVSFLPPVKTELGENNKNNSHYSNFDLLQYDAILCSMLSFQAKYVTYMAKHQLEYQNRMMMQQMEELNRQLQEKERELQVKQKIIDSGNFSSDPAQFDDFSAMGDQSASSLQNQPPPPQESINTTGPKRKIAQLRKGTSAMGKKKYHDDSDDDF